MKKFSLFLLIFIIFIFILSCNRHRSPGIPEYVSTPTITITITSTSTTIINSPTPSSTISQIISATYTDTITPTVTITFSNTDTPTSTDSPTITLTSTPTPTFTNTIPVIYLTATIQCTCFKINTCGSGSSLSSPGPITVDDMGYVWVSEGTTCAYIKQYDPSTGVEVSSKMAYLVYGLEYYNNTVVSTYILDTSYIQYFPTFSKTLTSPGPNDHYRGLAYDGTNWWTVYAKGWGSKYYETKLQKFSSTGELLASYDAPYLENKNSFILDFPQSCWDISYSSWTNSLWIINKNRLYRINTNGEVMVIYDLGSWSFNGVHFINYSYSSFYATYQPRVGSYQAKVCYCYF
ncbi:MAG: hypothetical protein N2749_01960 [Clostridia bacterium]|nr:hypothetical protein [Clostridia bacterium]